jgi:hypothetical protein
MLYQMTHQELPGFYVTVRANWYTDLEWCHFICVQPQ